MGSPTAMLARKMPAAKSRDNRQIADGYIALLLLPCSLYLRGEGSSEVLAAVRSANADNRRAKDLEGEDLLTEFHQCAAYALRLGQFAGILAHAMTSPDHYEWPERPKIPSRADFSELSRR